MTKSNAAKQLMRKSNNYYMYNNAKMLNNKYLLYLVLVLVILDMFIFVNVGEVFYIFLYILFGALVSLYSGNILVILAGAMILTNIVKVIMRFRYSEGFETASLDLGKEIFHSLKDDEKEYFRNIARGKLEPLSGLSKNEQEIQEQIIDYLNSEEAENEEAKKTDEADKVDEQIEKLVGFTTDSEDKKPTLEGLDEIDKEAQKLIKTQETLQKNMKSLEPMLNQAQKFMNDLNKIKK